MDQILAKVPDNNKNYFKSTCGLPVSPYFSAFKLRWLRDNVRVIRKAIKARKCLFGTVDTWILWVNLSKIKINRVNIKIRFLEFDWWS